ncbi:protein phosphatase 2C domain-containing protein [Paenibacillus thermotolerans]|uniref:protein phosphatase 2C domain-containing protein n=1 Tax=Paenibacillus thermotolerans TaxID=3027807 RepID=UPI0023683CC0|nr:MULTISPECIES: protein phosphatase 2C domain-containing protein [unclassified Paenibacillus]
MNIEKLSIKGSGVWNEDALLAEEDRLVFGVIDGATSLVPFRGNQGETGGYLASRIIGDSVRKAVSGGGGNVSLRDSLVDANRELRLEMERCGIDTSAKEQLWGAAAVVVRIGERSVEYAQAGDCMLIAVYSDGTIRAVTRDQTAHLDGETHRLWAEGVANGLRSKDELWRCVLPQIVSGRRLTNTAEGYAVLNGDPELEGYVEYGAINRIRLKALLLMSDGLYVPKPPGETPFNAEEACAKVMEMGLAEYVDWLVRLEQSDEACLRYPRVKTSDDKTAIWIEL